VIPVKKEASIVDLIDYLEQVTPTYFALQDDVVASSTDLHKQDHCKFHPLFTIPCAKCALDVEFIPTEQEAFIDPIGYETEAGPFSEKSYFERVLMREFSDTKLTPDDFTFGLDADPTHIEYTSDEHDWGDRARNLMAETRCCISDMLRTMRAKVERDRFTQGVLAIAGVGVAIVTLNHFMTPSPYEGEGAIISHINAAAKVPRQLVDRDNKYQRCFSNVAIYPEASKSSTLEQLECKIDRNLHVAIVQRYDENLGVPYGEIEWCNAFPLGKCNWAFVKHQFAEDVTYHVHMRTHPGVGIKSFTALVNKANIREVDGIDACVVNLPAGGDTTDFRIYMKEKLGPDDLKPGMPLFIYHVHKCVIEGKTEEYVAPSQYRYESKIKKVKLGNVKKVGQYIGFSYNLQTHKGMCGSLVFTAGRNPVLIGMHGAGDQQVGEGFAMLMTRDWLEETMSPETIQVKETAPLREEIYGVDTTVDTVIHDFNPIHFLEKTKEHNLEIYGQHKLPLSRFTSDVRPSLVQAQLVERGFVVKDTAPTKKAVRPSRHTHLDKTSEVLPPINPRIMKLAKEDLKAKLKQKVFKEKSCFKDYVHPLSDEHALNGVPGVKGIEPVNPVTAMSHPLQGPKWKFMMDCELKKHLGLKTPRFVRQSVDEDGNPILIYELLFDPEKADVKEEMEITMQCWLDGKRSNVVFKTNCKDAAISFAKAAQDKIRIFSGAPVAFVIITRMLTLTLINSMTYFPIEFESAVGVDASGRDWDYLAEHLQKFSGGQRCGDGDFSAFDQKLRPDFTIAAFEILKMCLVECGFDETMLSLFDGMATECIYPLYDNDGLVVKVFGSGPSGHSTTVVGNGLNNALYLRYAYYAMHERKMNRHLELYDIPLFHTVITLLTYGDDNIFEVHPKEELFNMMSVGEELARIGVMYTDSDKQISTVPFKTLEELSFLKRTFHVHPTIGKRVGALDPDSIDRSLLLSRKLPKNCDESEAQIEAGKWEQALYEAYLHGEEVYTKYLNVFDELKDTKDSAGYRIGTYYNPPTPEKILERYNQSKCCYARAQAVLEGDASGYETESGAYEPESGLYEEDEDEIGDMTWEFLPTTQTSAGGRARASNELETNPRWQQIPAQPGRFNRHVVTVPDFDPYSEMTYEEALFYEVYQEYMQLSWMVSDDEHYYFNVCDWPPPSPLLYWPNGYDDHIAFSFTDVFFRRWCVKHYPETFAMLFQEDMRLLEDFKETISNATAQRLLRKAAIARVTGQIDYLWAEPVGQAVCFNHSRTTQPRAFTLVRKLYRRRTEPLIDSPFPWELNDLVWSYLQTPMEHLVTRHDGLEVWVTPGYRAEDQGFAYDYMCASGSRWESEITNRFLYCTTPVWA
jgi:hypothetical protein